MKKWIAAVVCTDLGILILLALVRVVLHTVTNGQYGFHRDELQTVDDARHLAWGFVPYPPVTPAIARVALTLFGNSLAGLRLFSAMAVSIGMVLTGLMARELGGGRREQVLAAVVAGIAPISLVQGTVFQYVSFDYLWWVLLAYLLLRLLNTNNARLWMWIGAVIGIGMMTKYTMIFCVAGLAGGVLLTDARRYLRSPWLWAGVGVSLLIFLPNLIWQIQHEFISLEFLKFIHARDVRIGRTTGFLREQLIVCINLFTAPLGAAGLYSLLIGRAAKKYRPLGWMFVITFSLFWVANSRSYYTGPLYPMIIAAGCAAWGRRITSLSPAPSRTLQGTTWAGAAFGAIVCIWLFVPVSPVQSRHWDRVNRIHDMFREEIGWPDLVETVASVYQSLPEGERAHAGILAGNYGEAGAINLYGPAYHLPQAISGTNSAWYRGYGDPPPQTLVVVGLSQGNAEGLFKDCELAARNTNRYGVVNEETGDHPDIFVCRDLRQPWPEFWKDFRHFG